MEVLKIVRRERVHFCDFPIAIYGRISPCELAFCLDCTRSDSICYLCDKLIQKIQAIKMMEGIFICTAPHCLKSFLKRSDFEAHIYNIHSDLLMTNAQKDDGNESEVQSIKQPTTSDSVQAPTRPIAHSGSSSQLHDFDDKARQQQTREPSLPRPTIQLKPPYFGQAPNYPSEIPPGHMWPPGFDRPGLQNPFPQNTQGTPQQDSSQFSDK